jgi:hypothetical protein
MRWLAACAVLAIAGGARGDVPPMLSTPVIDALTLTDSLASSNDFELVFAGSAAATVAQLASIAQDSAADVGVQLRAIRGLAQFPGQGSAPHDTLVAVIGAGAGARAGSPVLLLRAAIEALGALAAAGHAGSDDEALLAPHLNDESRDVRATTARALGQLCDQDAVAALRLRNDSELTPQVSDAIADAIRALASCAAP